MDPRTNIITETTFALIDKTCYLIIMYKNSYDIYPRIPWKRLSTVDPD
jgi:hypothetical protein